MKIILGFDIGNTNTRMGIFAANEIIPRKIYSYNTDRRTSAGRIGTQVKKFLSAYNKETNDFADVAGFVFSSVVTEVNGGYHKAARRFFKLNALEVNNSVNLGIKINYDNPAELGADRITNAVAAHREYRGDKIIIDVGTAITFCVLLGNGTFDGGLITAGVGVAIDALAEKTSKLIKVDFVNPGVIAAKNSRDALRAGFFHGWTSMISGLIHKIEAEYNRKFSVILAGGYADIIAGNIGMECRIDHQLTMKGLKYIYDMNPA